MSSKVDVDLNSSPTKRGLIWHRTYDVKFQAQYEIANTTAQDQIVGIKFTLPSKDTSYDNFLFQVGESSPQDAHPTEGVIRASTTLAPGAKVPVSISYDARGTNVWAYTFPNGSRVHAFTLKMTAHFPEINFPSGATSPKSRELTGHGSGWTLQWDYKEVIDARNIAMDMPKVLSAGPVLARITFFAPLSLALFFTVLLVFGVLRKRHLHPVTYSFLAGGYFSYYLLLAYLADLINLHTAFAISAVVSLTLVCGYIHVAAGRVLSIVAAVAQGSYMIVFSYGFFFDGLTGLTLTITGILTLAMLMMATAKVDWEKVDIQWKKTAPPMPRAA
jgi:inner membrane protein involved in colicin E2 resistance